jgi:hypothetical protein
MKQIISEKRATGGKLVMQLQSEMGRWNLGIKSQASHSTAAIVMRRLGAVQVLLLLLL